MRRRWRIVSTSPSVGPRSHDFRRRHVVPVVGDAVAAGAEEEYRGDERRDDAGDADEECPVELEVCALEVDIPLLGAVATVDADGNADADHCRRNRK